MGKKRTICRECSKAKFPAISAAKLGHEACLVTAYRVLGVFNERDAYGATPIHYAARGGQLDCLKWLIANSGISPVAAAKNGTTAAHDAAAMGHLTCLQHLLENTRCSPQDRTNEGATVLHMACRFGHVAVTRWLIERGLSSPCDKGDNGVTPVHLCAAKNHLDCLKYLTKSSRYLPDQLTVHGATPVYFAAQEGSLECLQWLVEHGNSDPSIFANDGMNPLHAAAQAGELSCMKWLVNHGGVSPRQKAEDGATPMHFAASGGKILCLKWLFENGGSLLDRDDLGGTPLHDAAEQGQIEAVSFILSCGIQKDIPDNEGLTPIDLAKDNNHEECMKLFYIRSPTLLNSLTPQHPQNRASTSEEEMIRREKQRQFEKALLSNTTKQERDDMWKEAKENKPDPQPVPGPSDSSRRSKNRNSLDAHRLSLSLINDLIDDHAGKERPALSPELFLQHPLNDDVKEGDAATDIVDTSEVEKVVQDILKEINPNQSTEPDSDDSEGGGTTCTATVEDGHTVSPTAHHLTDIIIDNEADSNPYDTFFGATESSNKQKTKPKAAPPKSPLKEQQQLAIPTTHHYQDGISKEDTKPPSSTTSAGKKKSSSTGWKAVLQRLSPRKSKSVVQTPVTTAAIQNSTTPTSSSGNKPKGKKKKGKKNKTNHQESTVAAGHGKPPDDKPVQKTKTKKKKQSAEDQTPSTEDVVMRRKPNKNSSDKVFSHRTSKIEEYAIVSQRRTSTNDEEVAVKFESRPIAARQSRLSTLSDDMSSPESSSDEHNHDNEDNMDEDIFRPISRTGFNKFGEPIEEDEREGNGLLLENTGSLASLDTMIVHEDEVDEAINVLQNTGSLKDLQVEEEQQEVEVEVEDDQPVVAEAGNDMEQSMESACSSELRPSPSPNKRERKQMMLIPEEDEDEEDFEGESEDTLAPLPSIINSSYHIDNSSRNELTMDRLGENNSPTGTDGDHHHDESTELNPDVVIKIESVPGFPMASNQGVRSFALVKQMYDSQGGGGGGSGVSTPRSLLQRRHSPVFSPLMVVATVSPRTSLTSVKEEDVNEATTKERSSGSHLPTVEENTEQTNDEMRISLTPSQEAAFDNLEKLKDSLMRNDEMKEEEPQQENDENVTAKDHKQALRTSPAVEELSNMIKGLDDLIEEKRKQPISEPPSDGRGNVNSPDISGSGLGRNGTGNYLDHVNARDDISEDFSVMGSDIQSLSSTPRQNAKHDVDHDHKKEPPTVQLGVNVEIDGFERIQLTVKSSLLVISLIFKAAEAAGLELTKYHTLFEVNNSLRIERPLEDHESIGEIMSKWPKKNPPHFHLHTYHEKYLLWEKNPLPKGYVGQFLKQGKTPNISSSLHFCKGVNTSGLSSSKGKWLNGTHCLGSLGIYQINTAAKSSSSTGSGSMDLVCGTDQLLYLPLHTGSSVDWHRYKPLPSKHCFVLKPGSSWREKDMKIFCCDDYQSYSQWVSGIRLVKYGLQLKCNYVAMCKRLEQLPAPAAAITST